MTDFMKLQCGNDICGVALEGVPGEEVDLIVDHEVQHMEPIFAPRVAEIRFALDHCVLSD